MTTGCSPISPASSDGKSSLDHRIGCRDGTYMSSLATEFPVRSIRDRAQFVAQVVSWLKGTSYSTILDRPHETDLHGDTAHLRSKSGEELRFREFCEGGSLTAIGCRHDFPDNEGRVWRTEAVLRRDTPVSGQDLIRVRTQCLAKHHDARVSFPRKPYLIKALLNDNWGGTDGDLSVSDVPVWLADTVEALNAAHAATIGAATKHLPVVYVSAVGTSKWVLDAKQIEKLAFDLGGIAHVVVEPNSAFSFRLRDLTGGVNAYGGTIAVSAPGRGIIRQARLGFRAPDPEELLVFVRNTATNLRTQMPTEGWDWTELQEQALRLQRERDRNKLSVADMDALYKEEVVNLKEKIVQLEEQISSRTEQESAEEEDQSLLGILGKKLGSEIYRGEFADRLRMAVLDCLSRAEQTGLDDRSKFVLGVIADGLPLSPELGELLDDLKRATKDPKKVASELTSLLARHGYREKSDNRHIRLEPKSGYDGLDNITVPKTPSDSRGLINLRKQVERTLGIARLSE
ncbi:hypothetical protein SAMN05444123_11853 [Rhodopseudomonas pseudopalustris]|uniref:Uncharacterized protein n=2 Tax=Rhodopseudomonas pseudopalustris TaxID=1513892 RepID=A0A1H8XAY1_9BRAD|nr:hypothetical protein SAMN05444123_11853 [Rhodopseudomonas pseudopalustris]